MQTKLGALGGHHRSQSIFHITSYPLKEVSTQTVTKMSHVPPNSRSIGSIRTNPSSLQQQKSPWGSSALPQTIPTQWDAGFLQHHPMHSEAFSIHALPVTQADVPSPANSFSKTCFFHEELTRLEGRPADTTYRVSCLCAFLLRQGS